jgi:membrane protein insertase Oxa1/YidC/SpoIIIJ
MRLLFGAWAVALPLAVGVYYATSSVFRAALQWGITRHMST